MATVSEAIQSGESPYLYFLEYIRRQNYGSAEDGFKTRLEIAIALTGYYTIIAFAWLMVLLETYKERNGGSGIRNNLWIVRRTHIQSSLRGTPIGLISVNTKLTIAFGLFLTGFYLTQYLINAYFFYVKHVKVCGLLQLIHQPLLPHFLCITGFLVTFGTNSQVLAMRSDLLSETSIKTFNRLVIVLGSIFAIGIGIFATAFDLASTTGYWKAYWVYFHFLEDSQSTFTGTLSESDAVALENANTLYFKALRRYALDACVEYGSLVLFASVILLVNLSTIWLARILKVQIHNRIEQSKFFNTPQSIGFDGNHAPSCGDVQNETPPEEYAMSRIGTLSNGKGEEKTFSDVERTISSQHNRATADDSFTRNVISNSVLKELATKGKNRATTITIENGAEGPDDATDNLDRMNAIQILELQSSRRYVMAVGAIVALAATFSMCVAIYVVASVSSLGNSLGPFYTSFLRKETTIFSFPWGCAFSLAPLLTVFLYLQCRQLALARIKAASKLEISKVIRVDVEGPEGV